MKLRLHHTTGIRIALAFLAAAGLATFLRRDDLAMTLMACAAGTMVLTTLIVIARILLAKSPPAPDESAPSEAPPEPRWTTGSYKGDTLVWALLLTTALLAFLFGPEIAAHFD